MMSTVRQNIRNDVKSTSWRQERGLINNIQKYFMTSKNTSHTSKVRHNVKIRLDVKKYVTMSKVRHDVKRIPCLYTKSTDVKKYVMTSKVHDVQIIVMTSKVRHDVKNISNVCYDVKGISKVCHDVKNIVMASWRETYRHGVMTSKTSSWCQKYVITSKREKHRNNNLLLLTWLDAS